MTEDQAHAWFAAQFGEHRTARIGQFLAMVAAENERQNLVSPTTIDQLWARHAVDSAQLLRFATWPGLWLDVGTGGGFPGMIAAILRDEPVVMAEPRTRRAEFLLVACQRLELTNATIMATKVENIQARASVISARAVASIEKLLQATAHCATPATRWILPRGRLDPDQLAVLRQQERGKVFHVEHSLTDPQSTVLIIDYRA